jgi:hypothetical protein
MTASFLKAGLLLATLTPLAAAAQTAANPTNAAELQQLRQEIQALRASYEARLQALEQRLRAAEAPAAAAPAAPTAPVAAAAPAAPSPASPGTAGANAFNPAISLILSGTYTRTSQDPQAWRLSGFALPAGAEAGPGTRGFSLAESELGLAASIDPWWQGRANIALHPDDSVSVEEAVVQTTALGHGLTLKAGRFFSGIGYLNEQHAHTWDFVDNPLAYQALLNGQHGDDGLQLRWLAPTELFLQFGAEVGRGSSSGNGAGMVALSAHAGDDVGTSHSWRAGLSVLQTKADGLALAGFQGSDGSLLDGAFSGRTRVWVADAVWKWAPNGNATRTSFKLQGEFLRSTRRGQLTLNPDGDASSGDFRVTQQGWYLQGVYQFAPGWRVALRTEQLDPGRASAGANAALLASADHKPRRHSLALDYSFSEFSRIRLQAARDLSRQGLPDNQLFLQYQMSLGAHGAHAY